MSHSSGFGGWFAHALLTGFIHSAIYHMLAPLFRGQSLIGALMIGAGLLLFAYVVGKMFMNARALRRSRW